MTFLSSLKRNKVLSEWIEKTLTSCHWVPSFPWEHIPIIFFPHSSSYIRSCWLLSDLSSQSQGTVSSTWFSMMRIISTPSEQNVSMQQYQAHVTRFSQHCGLISYKKLQIYVKFFQPNDICPEALELIFFIQLHRCHFGFCLRYMAWVLFLFFKGNFSLFSFLLSWF